MLVPQTISVTCKLGSAPAGSRPAVVSVTFALQVTGDSQRVVRAAVITTRHLANHRRVCVLTVNTALQGRTVKCARSVTMETPQVVSEGTTLSPGPSAFLKLRNGRKNLWTRLQNYTKNSGVFCL